MTSDLRQSRVVKLIQNGNASFSAFRANRNNYEGLFSPVMGFDDFRLDKDVFGPHQHRHMSALSYLFDDSAPYHNRDSMGSDLTISAGSLLWTWAGSGVTHHEFPENEGEKTHGLQLFLEIPVETRNQAPKGLLIPVEEMPVKDADGARVKVVLGSAAGMVNYIKTPEDITFLDVQLQAGKSFLHTLPKRWNATVYVLSGALTLDTPAGASSLNANDTVALGASDADVSIAFHAEVNSHVLFISGLPVV